MRALPGTLLALATVAPPSEAAPPAELKNWFNDPFVRLSDAVRDCPEPLGPRMTAAEQLKQAHHRAERGTSCWLQGKCERSNAFEYDSKIAENFKQGWVKHPEFQSSTVWLTVQGRVVYLDGCATEPDLAAKLEQFARSIPKVTQAIASIRTQSNQKPPYAVWPQPNTRRR